MTPVVIESPFAGCVPLHKAYLQACTRDCLRRGETPYASHQMLTDALDDLVPGERELGISAGLEMRSILRSFGAVAAYYVDLGWSSGMTRARGSGSNLEERTIRDHEWVQVLWEAREDELFNGCAEQLIADDPGTRICADTARNVKALYRARIKGGES